MNKFIKGILNQRQLIGKQRAIIGIMKVKRMIGIMSNVWDSDDENDGDGDDAADNDVEEIKEDETKQKKIIFK